MASQFDFQWVSRLLLSRSCDLGSTAIRRSARHIEGALAGFGLAYLPEDLSSLFANASISSVTVSIRAAGSPAADVRRNTVLEIIRLPVRSSEPRIPASLIARNSGIIFGRLAGIVLAAALTWWAN